RPSPPPTRPQPKPRRPRPRSHKPPSPQPSRKPPPSPRPRRSRRQLWPKPRRPPPNQNRNRRAPDAKDEDPLRRQEALQADRQRQVHAPSRHALAHPGEEDAEAEARLPSAPARRALSREARQGPAAPALRKEQTQDPRQAIRSRAQEAPQGSGSGLRLLGPEVEGLQAREGAGSAQPAVRLSRPARAQARFPPAVDRSHQ